MEKIRKKVNIAFILLTLIAFGLALAIGVIITDSQAEAEQSENLVVSTLDTEEAHIVKVSNIKQYNKGIATLSNTDSKVELGKEIYRLLGSSEEDINNMTDEELEEITEYDEVERQYSILYIPETLSNDQVSLNVVISNPSEFPVATETFGQSMSLTLTFARNFENDYENVSYNKDGEIKSIKNYMGLKVSMKLTWVRDPIARYVDKLYIFTSKKMQESETKYRDEVLSNESNSSKYLEFTKNIEGSKISFTGNYYYRILISETKGTETKYTSETFLFRVIYLHHSSASVGFDGNVTVDSANMDVKVTGGVIRSEWRSNIYALNVN
ncbi:MAG: hypothetical protein K2G70_04485 [Turicibacter sp.]|nr:hypothetical protein [Turicibacter sp.]